MTRLAVAFVVFLAVVLLCPALIDAAEPQAVEVEEGVFRVSTDDGSVHRRYVGIVGNEKRVAELRTLRDALLEVPNPNEAQLKKLHLVGKEIHFLESALSQLPEQSEEQRPSKAISDCRWSNKSVEAGVGTPYGTAGFLTWAEASFTAFGSCRANAVASAYAYSGTGSPATDFDNTGGYVASVDIRAEAAAGYDGDYCQYSSVAMAFNESGQGLMTDVHEYPPDCYDCPNCS